MRKFLFVAIMATYAATLNANALMCKTDNLSTCQNLVCEQDHVKHKSIIRSPIVIAEDEEGNVFIVFKTCLTNGEVKIYCGDVILYHFCCSVDSGDAIPLNFFIGDKYVIEVYNESHLIYSETITF